VRCVPLGPAVVRRGEAPAGRLLRRLAALDGLAAGGGGL